jgi:RNA ligase
MNLLQTLEQYHNEGWLIKQKHPNLPITIWNYSKTTQYARKWDKITLMCRGLVTMDDTGEILARPFKKFFNIEENQHTSTPDFNVFEKMDGSLIISFYLWGSWIFASRGSFTSDQAKAASKLFYSQYNCIGMNMDATYLFEFTAPWNRIVVDYGDKENLTLLGAIRNEDGVESPWWHLELVSKENKIDLVKKYDGINDYTTLKSKIQDNAEGFVIKFSNGDKIKIKGEEYLRLHKIMTNISTTDIWETLSDGGNMEEILKDVPDEFYDKIKEVVGDITVRFYNIRTDYIKYFTDIVFKIGREDRRRFAEEARRYNHSSILFAMLDGKDINPIIWKIVKPEWRKL